MDHPFFEDINWKDVLNHHYKYDKQAFLKLNIVGSNFSTDHIQGSKEVNAGIDIENECALEDSYSIEQNGNQTGYDNDQFFSGLAFDAYN